MLFLPALPKEYLNYYHSHLPVLDLQRWWALGRKYKEDGNPGDLDHSISPRVGTTCAKCCLKVTPACLVQEELPWVPQALWIILWLILPSSPPNQHPPHIAFAEAQCFPAWEEGEGRDHNAMEHPSGHGVIKAG